MSIIEQAKTGPLNKVVIVVQMDHEGGMSRWYTGTLEGGTEVHLREVHRYNLGRYTGTFEGGTEVHLKEVHRYT